MSGAAPSNGLDPAGSEPLEDVDADWLALPGFMADWNGSKKLIWVVLNELEEVHVPDLREMLDCGASTVNPMLNE